MWRGGVVWARSLSIRIAWKRRGREGGSSEGRARGRGGRGKGVRAAQCSAAQAQCSGE